MVYEDYWQPIQSYRTTLEKYYNPMGLRISELNRAMYQLDNRRENKMPSQLVLKTITVIPFIHRLRSVIHGECSSTRFTLVARQQPPLSPSVQKDRIQNRCTRDNILTAAEIQLFLSTLHAYIAPHLSYSSLHHLFTKLQNLVHGRCLRTGERIAALSSGWIQRSLKFSKCKT